MNQAQASTGFVRIDTDALKDVSDWLAARISAVRVLCYEAVVDAALCTHENDLSLAEIRDRIAIGVSDTRDALERGMFDRYDALGITINGAFDTHRRGAVDALTAFEAHLATCIDAGRSECPAVDDIRILKEICLEQIQPSTTSLMTCLFQLAATKQTEVMDEKQSYILSSIVGIEQVASRINLIAINVAIEAARNGEAGSAFSVIAREIQELARRAKEATEEITRRIKS